MYKYSVLFTFRAVFKSILAIGFSYYSFMCSCISIISSFENIRTDFKIEIFPIPITYWSGFGILKQDWDGSVSLKIGR